MSELRRIRAWLGRLGWLAGLGWLACGVLPAKTFAMAAPPAPSPRSGAAGHPSGGGAAGSPAAGAPGASAAGASPASAAGVSPAPAGSAPAPSGSVPAAGVVMLWWVPGSGSGAQGAAVARDVRRLVAAAADELDALVVAARGEAPQGGPGGQPAFWSGAGALQRSLADLDGALTAGDARFFVFLDEAQRSLVALQVACRRTSAPMVARGAEERVGEHGVAIAPAGGETARRMSALADTMRQLGGSYGREAARAQLGGGLSAEQAQQLQRIARAARRWRAQVATLAAAARQAGDAALRSELARLDALLQQLAAERLTLAAYLAAIQASNQALALWAANAAYLAPGEQQAWQLAELGAADLTTAADTGFVFSADLSGGATWAYAEGDPGGDAGAAAGEAGAAAGDPGAAAGDAGAAAGDAGAVAGDPGAVAGDVGAPVGGRGAATGGPGEVSGVSGAMGMDPSQPGGGGMPGDLGGPSGGAASADLAAVYEGEAALAPVGGLGPPGRPAPGSSSDDSGAAGSGWVVIHGGPDPSRQSGSVAIGEGRGGDWQPAAATAAAPLFAMQLGDAPDDGSSPADPEPDAAAGDLAAGAPRALEWEEICRPWQPGAGIESESVCPLTGRRGRKPSIPDR